MDHFNLVSEYSAQPATSLRRLKQLVRRASKKATSVRHCLGVTGSGKTFTMANVIAAIK